MSTNEHGDVIPSIVLVWGKGHCFYVGLSQDVNDRGSYFAVCKSYDLALKKAQQLARLFDMPLHNTATH